MEIFDNKQTPTVTHDLKSRNNLGNNCVDKEALKNVEGKSYPKLFIKLEKLDVTVNMEVVKNSKFPKTVQPDADSIPNCKNIVTSSNSINNQEDNLIASHHQHTMLIKQEKSSENITQNRTTNSSDDTSESDTNSQQFTISSITSAIDIKQEKVSESTTKDLKNNAENRVSEITELHSSKQSKVYKPGAASKPKPAVQKTGSETRTEANLNFSSSKTSKPRSKPSASNSNNSIPFNGAAFLHTQVHTNSALQSILKDIVSLNEEYHYTDDRLLEVEIEKLRARNKLPSLRTLDPFANIEDSESLEDSCQESDDETGNLGKDSGFDNESQESESNSEIKKKANGIVKDDIAPHRSNIYKLNTEEDLEDSKDSERLIIDELNTEQASPDNNDSERLIMNEPDDESEDEPDYVDVQGIQLGTGKCTDSEVLSINGTLVEIDNEALECPFCATLCKTINSLKQHVQACLDNKLSQNIPQSSDSEKPNSVQNNRVSNNSNEDAASSIKIGRVFSIGKELIECDSDSSTFVKTKDDRQTEKPIKTYKNKKFRRTCKECEITFCDKAFLDAHFQKTGHSEVYPLMPCKFCNYLAFNPSEFVRHMTYANHASQIKKQKMLDKSKSNGMEIIEIDD